MFDLRRWDGVVWKGPALALELCPGPPEPRLFGTFFKPGGPRYLRGFFPLPTKSKRPLDTDAIVTSILSQPPYNFRFVPSLSAPGVCAFQNRPLTTPKLTVRTFSMMGAGEDAPHSPSDRISEKGRENVGVVTVDDIPGETQEPQSAKMDIDLDGGSSNPASGCSPQSDPVSTPSTGKPKPKSVFVKIMELDEEHMFIAWLQAFFGESPGSQQNGRSL